MKKYFVIVICLAFFNHIQAQENISLEDIYSKKKYKSETFGPVKWIDNGQAYTSIEKHVSLDGHNIVKHQCKNGTDQILLSAEQLIPKGKSTPLKIKDYFWSSEKDKVLIFTNTRRVWRYHTQGDYWVYDFNKKELKQLAKNLSVSSTKFAKFSPDGKQVAYVSNRNIYVENLENHKIEQITQDGSEFIINGTFDWVYEEELSLRDGFRWSPDGGRISYWQQNTKGVGTFYMVNNLDSIYPKLIPIPYPKVGTTNPSAKIGVYDFSNSKTTWMKIPGDSRNNYLARMDWAENSEELIIQQLNRKQNSNKVYLADAQSGSSKVVHHEVSDTWLEVNDDLSWLNNGKEFTWSSDLSGWMHLYQVKRDGSDIQPITQGDFEMISLLGIDEKKGYVYYIASPDRPTERFLYRSKLNGKGKLERLTPEDSDGHHKYLLSPDYKYAIHTYSNNLTPPTVELISLPDHKVIRVLEGNEKLNEQLTKVDIQPKEFFEIKAKDGLGMNAWMIKPKDFDRSKKYPVIFFVYGEPAGSTVQNNWSSNGLWHQFLAQQGYLIVSVDNRGTNTPKGRAWRKSVYRQIGIQASIDQADAALQIREWDFVDPERIGIWGWSGGGSMTLNALFRYPEIYKTGIAIAFISNQRLYDTTYQERFMDLPEDNEYGYREGSPITHAKNLEGNLLLIHGSGDDNCHYQSCQMLVNELIKENKYFTMIDYPMRSHSISERENTSMHLRKTMHEYFKRHLTPGAK